MDIFDMCSAPGGKALGICMTTNLKENGGHLYCADVSSGRRERLKRAVTNYIPIDVRDHISVITGDATTNAFVHEFGFNRFDRVWRTRLVPPKAICYKMTVRFSSGVLVVVEQMQSVSLRCI